MELFDSHAHLNDEAFDNGREEVVKKCFESGVKYIAEIGYSEATSRVAVKFANQYDNIYAVIGAHPDECNNDVDLSFITELAQDKKVVAIGEVGLDYHYDTTNKEMQKKYFIQQINLANELSLPVAIHSRDADMDMLEILKKNKIQSGFVMHCFSSSVEVAKEILKLGGYISLAGPVTFKNARGLLDVAKMVPDDKILIETDCPYLAPEPYRGTRNDSSLVIYTVQKVADLREISLEAFSRMTVANTKRFYQIL